MGSPPESNKLLLGPRSNTQPNKNNNNNNKEQQQQQQQQQLILQQLTYIYSQQSFQLISGDTLYKAAGNCPMLMICQLSISPPRPKNISPNYFNTFVIISTSAA